MRYFVRVGFYFRRKGSDTTEYKKYEFTANDKQEAEIVARKIGNDQALNLKPDSYFIDQVWEDQ